MFFSLISLYKILKQKRIEILVFTRKLCLYIKYLQILLCFDLWVESTKKVITQLTKRILEKRQEADVNYWMVTWLHQE